MPKSQVFSHYPLSALLISGMTWWGFGDLAHAQQREIPESLQPWESWATWDDVDRTCPKPFNDEAAPICFWPSRLGLTATGKGATWNIEVAVFRETWVPLPGNRDAWPLRVLANGKPVAVVTRDQRPSIRLITGQYELSGEFQWNAVPQSLAIPTQIGLISLVVDDVAIEFPSWDDEGQVWLKRQRNDEAEQDFVAAQVYRIVEDGVPLWLRTEIELTVSGKSREELLGSVIPDGWNVSDIESLLPVAIDEQGHAKVQVRAGKWTIRVDAFRTDDCREVGFPEGSRPLVDQELVGFRANPEFRLAEVEGLPTVDVTQTTFPKQWGGLPVYQWKTETPFQLTEKMRGLGLRPPEALTVKRRLWLDEDGKQFTYHDTVTGIIQHSWRLDTAAEQALGAVQINGAGQLITVNPKTKAHGVEIRTRSLNLEADGRIDRSHPVFATGWQTDATDVAIALTLPPGWRLLALFGADSVRGDWLTAWTLLDLFYLLIFALAVFRICGVRAGIVAFLAFALSYHEPGAPRLTWLFLLIPVALLRIVPQGTAEQLVRVWRVLAIGLLLIYLIPFFANQIQGLLYPQLETLMTGRQRGFVVPSLTQQARRVNSRSVDFPPASSQRVTKQPNQLEEPRSQLYANMQYDVKARIQTGPGQPEWSWNEVGCRWDGPVSATQTIRPVLISPLQNRLLTILRLTLLILLAAILLNVRKSLGTFRKEHVAPLMLLMLLAIPHEPVQAQSGEFPPNQLLEQLRARLLEAPDVFPHAAEIPTARLSIDQNRVMVEADIHAAIRVAVPIPGRVAVWSPLSVMIDDQPAKEVCRRNGYLWVVVPAGVHRLTLKAMLPETNEWEWTYLLPPRQVTLNAPGWSVTGLKPNGVPEKQIFFVREQKRGVSGEATYDRDSFQNVVNLRREIEIGLVWPVRNEVRRLSPLGKPISLMIPLLPGENVLTSQLTVDEGMVAIQLGSQQETVSWLSELPVGQNIELRATETNQWVETWRVMTSPVWNMATAGLEPVFESEDTNLVPMWHPWPGESVSLTFSKPLAAAGETTTVQRVDHRIVFGSRQRNVTLTVDLESSLGGEFSINLGEAAAVNGLTVGGRQTPIRLVDNQVMVPISPGKQQIQLLWQSNKALETIVRPESVVLPLHASNVTTNYAVPANRWILWTQGPVRGPAVRFWIVLVAACLAAALLGSLSMSPLRRYEWALLIIGLMQVHLVAASLVIVWLFLLSLRGNRDPMTERYWVFNFRQIGLVLVTVMAMVILVLAVSKGLLGNPQMFILGNGSTANALKWFQPRTAGALPAPTVVSVSVWLYRLLMLLWALWLAHSLLRWLQWGWLQFSHGGIWRRRARLTKGE